MNTNELIELFETHNIEYKKFSSIPKESKLHNRPDLCALLKLDKLAPNEGMKILSNEYDYKLYISVQLNKVLNIITEDDVIYLLRCGVLFCVEYEAFYFNI